jgi:hypothetical protein
MGVVVGMLVVSACILVENIRRDEEQRKRELRSARARRLLYIDEGKEVLLPKLPPLEKVLPAVYPRADERGYPPSVPCAGPFHLFLSHNWEQYVDCCTNKPPALRVRDAPTAPLMTGVLMRCSAVSCVPR